MTSEGRQQEREKAHPLLSYPVEGFKLATKANKSTRLHTGYHSYLYLICLSTNAYLVTHLQEQEQIWSSPEMQ